ncbi:MAG: sugar phosphate isomerase/epimerase, partial [Candidatus Aminicenantes bacterium]|nr:sugar phosphate isomerase/epimerase [Candidatus Aminicenantes bacterium]
MMRPVTIFTGQWADLSFKDVCQKMSELKYDGLEIACWGDHMEVNKAAQDPDYTANKKSILAKYDLQCWALGAHLAGQCVGDCYDERLDVFAPDKVKGKPDELREWAIEEMKSTPQAAKNMGCKVVTCFMGSPIWKYWYSFPPTSDEIIEKGYAKIKKLWSP